MPPFFVRHHGANRASVAPRWSKDTRWTRKKCSFCFPVFCDQFSWFFDEISFDDFSSFLDKILWFFDEILCFYAQLRVLVHYELPKLLWKPVCESHSKTLFFIDFPPSNIKRITGPGPQQMENPRHPRTDLGVLPGGSFLPRSQRVAEKADTIQVVSRDAKSPKRENDRI